MNANKFTQKSLEAVQAAQTMTQEYGNQQIEQAHLMAALLEQENGLIPQLIEHMGLTGGLLPGGCEGRSREAAQGDHGRPGGR